MIHQTVDQKKWIERFPLDLMLRELGEKNSKDFLYYPPPDLVSPKHLAHHLQWLKKAKLDDDRIEGAVPVDYFLPALGEPAKRDESKIAGIPFLQKSKWPKDSNGKRMAFLAQICFSDSYDVLRVDRTKLEGDILLIFQEDPEEIIWSLEYGSKLHFVWMQHNVDGSDLVTADESHVPDKWYEPTHFHRFRTNESTVSDRMVTHKRGAGIFSKRVKIPVSHSIRATKIGGFPAWQQCESEGDGLGEYLCSIHSINPYGKEQPLVNVPEAPWGDRYSPLNLLMLGDLGTLYLFIEESGKINWLMQCG